MKHRVRLALCAAVVGLSANWSMAQEQPLFAEPDRPFSLTPPPVQNPAPEAAKAEAPSSASSETGPSDQTVPNLLMAQPGPGGGSGSAGASRQFFGDNPPGYKGGRGMITLQGMSGMFLNPTSGTLNQGQVTAQYCLFVNDYTLGDDRIIGHGLMLAYGVTDWLEVGLFGTLADVPGARTWFDDTPRVGGPFARLRIVREEGWIPEVSIGGMWIDGNENSDILSRKEAFIAASKGFAIDPEGYLRSIRVHAGYRYLSRTESPDATAGDQSFAYTGVEFELPYSIYIVGELQSGDLSGNGDNDAAYAIGLQWKPNKVLGISIAHMNPQGPFPGGPLKDGFWFGIGLNFKF